MTAEAVAGLSFVTDNIRWKPNDFRDGVVILGCVEATEALTVGQSYRGLPVLEIGDGAFAGNATLRAITLPGTVTRIGRQAFMNCVKLKTMN